MICHDMKSIGFTPAALTCGSMIELFCLRPGCDMTTREVIDLHDGKESYLNPSLICIADDYPLQFRIGHEQEQLDLRTMRQWEQSLSLCLLDRQKGGKR
jgi:hypothetical protein